MTQQFLTPIHGVPLIAPRWMGHTAILSVNDMADLNILPGHPLLLVDALKD